MTKAIQFRDLDRMTSQPRLSTLLQRSVHNRISPFYSPAQQPYRRDPLLAEFDWQLEFVYFGNHAEDTNMHDRTEHLSWSPSGG